MTVQRNDAQRNSLGRASLAGDWMTMEEYVKMEALPEIPVGMITANLRSTCSIFIWKAMNVSKGVCPAGTLREFGPARLLAST